MKKKLSVGVVGLSMGSRHLDAAIDYGAEIAAICDTNEATLKEIGDTRSIPEDRRFTDYRDMLRIEGMNVVILATPDQTHREMSEAFLDAGMHVMCEKPLALTREDMEAIIRAARAHSTKFMVGQICRFTPGFVKAKELVDAGVIGDLYYVESEYAHDYARIVADEHAWRSDPMRHGVVGGGCHAVDLLRWFAGNPEEVFAYGSHKMLPQVPYDDATIAVLKFPNGIAGKVFVSTGCKRPYTMRTLLYGTKGTIICDNTSPAITLYTVNETGIDLREAEEIPVQVNNHNAVEEFAVFAHSIENDTPVAMSAEEGAKTIAACLAIVESSEKGVPVQPDYRY